MSQLSIALKKALRVFSRCPAPRSPYDVLGVRPDATAAEIDAAYRDRAKAAPSMLAFLSPRCRNLVRRGES